jgi:hypothetical protein
MTEVVVTADVEVTAVELTPAELTLARNALKAFMLNFGHDEGDVLHQVRDLLQKVPEPR